MVGRVAVAAGVGGKAVVRGAEVGGRDDYGGAGEAVLEILDALDLVAAAARRAALEQRRAQPHRRHPVPVLPQIPEPARPTCTPHTQQSRELGTRLLQVAPCGQSQSGTVRTHDSGSRTCGDISFQGAPLCVLVALVRRVKDAQGRLAELRLMG